MSNKNVPSLLNHNVNTSLLRTISGVILSLRTFFSFSKYKINIHLCLRVPKCSPKNRFVQKQFFAFPRNIQNKTCTGCNNENSQFMRKKTVKVTFYKLIVPIFRHFSQISEIIRRYLVAMIYWWSAINRLFLRNVKARMRSIASCDYYDSSIHTELDME